jgi:hypothetical protein
MFPQEQDPKGDPETWSREELRRWLAAVCCPILWHCLDADRWQRNLYPQDSDSREQLLERVRANMRIPRAKGP